MTPERALGNSTTHDLGLCVISFVLEQLTKLFRIEMEQDQVVLVLVAEGALQKEFLDTKECYILDCVSEIFPYVFLLDR